MRKSNSFNNFTDIKYDSMENLKNINAQKNK